jgi:hypothetical protein
LTATTVRLRTSIGVQVSVHHSVATRCRCGSRRRANWRSASGDNPSNTGEAIPKDVFRETILSSMAARTSRRQRLATTNGLPDEVSALPCSQRPLLAQRRKRPRISGTVANHPTSPLLPRAIRAASAIRLVRAICNVSNGSRPRGWYASRGLPARFLCPVDPYFRTSLNCEGRSPKRRLR